MRALIRDGKTPDPDVFRPEVFRAMLDAGARGGFGSPFVGERYLRERSPVFVVPWPGGDQADGALSSENKEMVKA
jgi:hypothetical protein